MKKINIYSVLFSFISLFSCWSRAGAGLDAYYPVLERLSLKPPSVSLFDANAPNLFQQQGRSITPDEINLFISGEGKGVELPSYQGDDGHDAKFWKWFFDWFLTGRYRPYQLPGQSTLTNEPLSKEVTVESSKITPINHTNKHVATRQKGATTSAKKTSNDIANRPQNHSNGHAGSASACTPEKEVVSIPKAPESFEELKANAEANGVDFKDVKSDEKPASLNSPWAWNILGWIQGAFQRYREKGSPSEYTFNDVLAFEDPALPAFARGLLTVVQQKESVTDGTMTRHNQLLVTAALDYILIDHKIKTGAGKMVFDWREWVSTPPKPLKFSRLFNPAGYLQDTQQLSFKQMGKLPFHQLYKFKRHEYDAKSRPERFSSTSLWSLAVDLDRAASLHGDPFVLSLDSDPLLVEIAYAALNLIYNSDSRLSDRECFLVEYWIDCMITVGGDDVEGTASQWKRLISLEASASIEGENLPQSGSLGANGDRGGIKRKSARVQEYPNKLLRPCPSCGYRWRR